jgi:hypothetical protein
MSEIAGSSGQPPARTAVWEDFIDIFYAPSAVFRRREQGSVLVPMSLSRRCAACCSS